MEHRFERCRFDADRLQHINHRVPLPVEVDTGYIADVQQLDVATGGQKSRHNNNKKEQQPGEDTRKSISVGEF